MRTGVGHVRALRRLDRVAHAEHRQRLPGAPGRRPRDPDRADAARPGRPALREPGRPALPAPGHRPALRRPGPGTLAPYGRPRAVRPTGRRAHRAARGGAVHLGGARTRLRRPRLGQRAARRPAHGPAGLRRGRCAAGPRGALTVRGADASGAGPLLHPVPRCGGDRRRQQRDTLAGPGGRRFEQHVPPVRPPGPPCGMARAVPAGPGADRGPRRRPGQRRPYEDGGGAAGGGDRPRHLGCGGPGGQGPEGDDHRPRGGHRHPGEGPVLRTARPRDVLRVPGVDAPRHDLGQRDGPRPVPRRGTASQEHLLVRQRVDARYGVDGDGAIQASPSRTRSRSARAGAAPAYRSSPRPSPPYLSSAPRRLPSSCATAAWSPSCGSPSAGSPTPSRS